MLFDVSVANEVEDLSSQSLKSVLGGKAGLSQEPRYYRVVLGTCFVKPGEDPRSERILKATLAVGTTITTTGQLWRGMHGNVWAELDSRYKEWRWMCVLGPGFGIAGPLLAPEEEYGLIVGAPRRLRPRRKKKQEAPEEEEPEDDYPEDFESAEPTGSEVHFQVEEASIVVRTEPCTRASSAGSLEKGTIVFGKPYSFSGNPWLRIGVEECRKHFSSSQNGDGWVLIHGSCFGKGQLMRKLSAEEETEQLELRQKAARAALESEKQALAQARREAQAAMPGGAEAAGGGDGADASQSGVPEENTVGYFEVVCDEPVSVQAQSTVRAPEVLKLSRGKIIQGTVRSIEGILPGGVLWLCLQEAECTRLNISEGWILYVGDSGPALRMLNAEEESTWLKAQTDVEEERATLEAEKRKALEMMQALERDKAEFEAKKKAAEEAAAAVAAAAAADAASAAAAGASPAPAAAAAEQAVPAAGAAPAAPAGAAAPPPAKAVRPPGAVKDWSVDEVITFLESLELGRYTETFRDNGIDGEYLLDLSEADLTSEIGLPKLSARKLIKKINA